MKRQPVQKAKLAWTKPTLTRLEPTPELLERFAKLRGGSLAKDSSENPSPPLKTR